MAALPRRPFQARRTDVAPAKSPVSALYLFRRESDGHLLGFLRAVLSVLPTYRNTWVMPVRGSRQ